MSLTFSPLGAEENHNIIRYNLCILSRRKSYLDRNVHLFYIKKPTNNDVDRLLAVNVLQAGDHPFN